MTLYPYLFFTGNAAEAMEFYKEIFGGELKTMPNADGKGLMHADLSGGDISFMASDSDRTEPYGTSCISLSLNGKDGDKIKTAFEKLSDGATNITPLKVESWGDTFGQLTDKFGIDWMVNISAE
jgi:PhnB protein